MGGLLVIMCTCHSFIAFCMNVCIQVFLAEYNYLLTGKKVQLFSPRQTRGIKLLKRFPCVFERTYSFIQILTHDLFHNQLFLVFCSTLAGTAYTLTAHMTLVGKKYFFPGYQ